MAKKVQLTESKLIDMISEQVVSELSSDLLYRASREAGDRTAWPWNPREKWEKYDKDQWGNTLDKRGNRWADRARKFGDAAKEAHKREANDNELSQKALSIWNSENLENDIDWDESDWISSGDETYGPTVGGVTSKDGWEFTVYGNEELHDGVEIDSNEPIEFKTPEGETGSFYLIQKTINESHDSKEIMAWMKETPGVRYSLDKVQIEMMYIDYNVLPEVREKLGLNDNTLYAARDNNDIIVTLISSSPEEEKEFATTKDDVAGMLEERGYRVLRDFTYHKLLNGLGKRSKLTSYAIVIEPHLQDW